MKKFIVFFCSYGNVVQLSRLRQRTTAIITPIPSMQQGFPGTTSKS